MNEGNLPVEMSDRDFDYAEELLEALGTLHNREMDRQIAISKPLEGLLGKAFITSMLNDSTSNDGAIHAVFGNILSLLLVMEVKNHGGSGDPSTQVGFSYTRWWSDSKVRIFGTDVSMIFTLSRVFTFASGHAALASFSPSRAPGFAYKEELLSAEIGQCSH